MKKSEEYSTPLELDYIRRIAESLPKPQKRVGGAKSKAQLLYENRHNDPKAYEDYLNRPMVTKDAAQVLDQDGNVFVAPRSLNVTEVVNYMSLRHRSKNEQGDAFSEGEILSEELKQKAVSAFTCTPPAELTEQQKKMVKSLEPIQTIQKIGLIKGIKERFFAKKQETKGDLVFKGWYWTWEDPK